MPHSFLLIACEPVTVSTAMLYGSLALSAATTATSLVAQKQQVDAQTGHQQQVVAASNTETSNQLSRLRIEQAQDRESSAREGEKARKASQKAQSTAEVAAGEAGVAGSSVEALLRDYSVSLGQFKEQTLRQQRVNGDSFEDRARAISTDTGYKNLTLNAPGTGPNYAAAFVDLTRSGLSTYRQRKKDAAASTG